MATFPQPNEWTQLASVGVSPAQLMSGELTTAQLTQLKAQLGIWATVLDQRLTEIAEEQDRIEAVLEQIREALERIDARLESARAERRRRREPQPDDQGEKAGRRKARGG